MLLIPLHIIAGLTALAAGAVALATAKGAKTHRKSGLVFVIAMLLMAGSGALMAILIAPNRINVIAGLLTGYLVITGLLTVRRSAAHIRWMDVAAMLLGLAVGSAALLFGFLASAGGGRLDGMPAPGYFVFGTVALLGALGDARMMFAGGISGAPRLTRHLWRMCVAMFIATASFFLGQADEFPQAVRDSRLLPIPVLLVVLTSVYWWVRVTYTKWYTRTYKQVAANVSGLRAAVEPRQ